MKVDSASVRSNDLSRMGRKGVQVQKEQDRLSSNASSNRPRILGNKSKKSNSLLPNLTGTYDNRSNLESINGI